MVINDKVKIGYDDNRVDISMYLRCFGVLYDSDSGLCKSCKVRKDCFKEWVKLVEH